MQRLSKRRLRQLFILGSLICFLKSPISSLAQSTVSDTESTTLSNGTLENIIQYALKNQPLIHQSVIDEHIVDNTIKSRIADWFPQIGFNYSLQHNFQIQTSIIGGNAVQLGVSNTSGAFFTASQALFNRDVLLAANTRKDVRLQARQNTASNKIDLTVNVSKAFYDVLATRQQIDVAEGDIARLERSLKDATNQYKAGITDKIDYKRATISLNNTRATKKANEELLKGKIEYLKALMNYPVTQELNIIYDSITMEREMYIDTVAQVDFTARIEFRQLTTQRRLQAENLRYERWSFLPTAAVNGAYNANFLNNNLGDLYNKTYPNSFAALTVGIPIFQGGKRRFNINIADYQLKRVDEDIVNLKNNINSDYVNAMANYKGSLASFYAQKENVALAQEVYDVINLQYRSGIKTYLEVVTGETDLRLARINYYNALYQVLANKIDVQRALGLINF